MSAQTQEPRNPRRRAPIAITIGVVAALVIAFFAFTGLYADVLWYSQLGFLPVLTTEWISRIVLFLIGFLAMAVPVWASIQIAYRTRPVYAKLNSQLDRYQEVFEPLRRLAMYGIPVVLGIFAGVSASSRWEGALAWLNRTPFGSTDPQFGFDIGFYVFELPFYRSIVGFASAVVLLSILLVIATNYLYGAIRVSGREVVISKSARVQIAITAGIYLLLQAVSIWLDQYATVTETGSLITGAAYTDVNATIPGRGILAAVAGVVAILFFVTAIIGRWRLPLVGTALLIVTSLIIGSLYPWIIERFQVEPNAKSLEAPYMQRNIDLTRDAYGVADVEEIPFEAKTDAEQGALRADAETTANIRLMDPARDRPGVRAARAVPPVLPVPGRARRRPLRDRRRDPGHRGRRPRREALGPRRRRDLVQLAPRLHARLRPRRRGGQPALGRRPARLPPVGHPAVGRPRRVRAARLLRRGVARSTRSSVRPRATTPSSSTTRPAATTTSRPRRPSRATAGRRSTTSSRSSSTR